HEEDPPTGQQQREDRAGGAHHGPQARVDPLPHRSGGTEPHGTCDDDRDAQQHQPESVTPVWRGHLVVVPTAQTADAVAETLGHRAPSAAEATPDRAERTRGPLGRRGRGPGGSACAGPRGGDDRSPTGAPSAGRRRVGPGRPLRTRTGRWTAGAGGTGRTRAGTGCHGPHPIELVTPVT